MKTTLRDKWLISVIPALMSAIIYVFFIGGNASRTLNSARTQLDKARDQAQPDVTAKKQALASATDRLNRERQRSAALKSTSIKLPGIESASSARANALRMLSDLFASKDLILLKSTRVQDESNKHLPVQTEALAKRMTELAGFPRAEFWQLEIDGTYPNMLTAIQAMGHSGSFVIPVSIGMEPVASQNGELRWLLTVWI